MDFFQGVKSLKNGVSTIPGEGASVMSTLLCRKKYDILSS